MKKRPNIILITTDQQRGDCLGLEHPVVQTPNVDCLGRDGTWFRRAYAESPSCIPARFTLMTGMAPAATGLVGFKAVDMEPKHTLAGELTKAGYQTEMIGKITQAARLTSSPGTSDISMKLEPDHLGQMKVRLSINENQFVSARIQVESHEARSLIEKVTAIDPTSDSARKLKDKVDAALRLSGS